jgi:hypothetical protein
MGFEYELIGQLNFPHAIARDLPPRVADFFLTGRFSQDALENLVPDRPPPAGICRQPNGLGKVESWASAQARGWGGLRH